MFLQDKGETCSLSQERLFLWPFQANHHLAVLQSVTKLGSSVVLLDLANQSYYMDRKPLLLNK